MHLWYPTLATDLLRGAPKLTVMAACELKPVGSALSQARLRLRFAAAKFTWLAEP
jgi:hypothetical protein